MSLSRATLAALFVAVPWILMTAGGPQVDLAKEQAQGRFEASLKDLLERVWNKSVFTTTSVCVLNATAAIASGYNTRYKKDGSVMSVGGVALRVQQDAGRLADYHLHRYRQGHDRQMRLTRACR